MKRHFQRPVDGGEPTSVAGDARSQDITAKTLRGNNGPVNGISAAELIYWSGKVCLGAPAFRIKLLR